MEQPAAGQVNLDRTGGAIEGFESLCGALDAAKTRSVDGGGTIDGGNSTGGDTLTDVFTYTVRDAAGATSTCSASSLRSVRW